MSSCLPTVVRLFILCVSLFLLAGAQKRGLGNRFMASAPHDASHGDLYALCEIESFKDEIRVWPDRGAGSNADCDLIVIGDSFFNSPLDSPLFARQLAAATGLATRHVANNGMLFSSEADRPLDVLRTMRFGDPRPRILVLETVERYARKRAALYNTSAPVATTGDRLAASRLLDSTTIDYFIRNNLFLKPLFSLVKRMRFACFGWIDAGIGDYCVMPPMLFYHEDQRFQATGISEAGQSEMAAQVGMLRTRLKRQYDIDLLYVIVPDKATIYQDYLHNGTHNGSTLATLAGKLRRAGVPAVDLVAVYRQWRTKHPESLLYYKGDTHYTPLGKRLLVDECVRQIDALRAKRNEIF